MTKKLISLLLALTMALSLAACGKGGDESKSPADTGDGKLLIGLPMSPNCTDINDNYMTHYLENKLGIDLEFMEFSSNNTERAQQLATMVAASEELPDILINWVNLDKTLVHTYGKDGYFVDLAPYFDNPDWELAKEYGWFEQAQTRLGEDNYKRMMYANRTAEGNLYGWPSGGVSKSDAIMNHVYINQAWLDKLGLETPRTWEQLVDVCIAFRDQDPNGNGKADEIAMMGGANVSAVYAADIPSWLLNNFCFVSDNYFFNVDEDGKLFVPYNTDEYREGLRAINKLYEEGLISPLTWTIGTRTEMPGMWTPASGEAIVGIMCGYAPQHTTEGSPLVLDYVPLEPLEGAYTPIRPAGVTNQTHITIDCVDRGRLETAMRFLFELNEVDNQRVAKYGEEGVDWEPIEVDGREIVNKINDVYNNPNNKTWCWNTPCIGYAAGESPYEEYVPEVDFETLEGAERIEYWRNNMLDMMVEANYPNTVNNPELFFSVVYSEEETEENGSMISDIKTFMKQQRGLFITGQLDIDDDAAWKTYMDALDVQGLPIVLENAQAAWDRQQ